MFERNSLRLSTKGKQYFYQAEELGSKKEDCERYAIFFTDLAAVHQFEKSSRSATLTVKNFFGSYHPVAVKGFEYHQSNISDSKHQELFTGVLTVQQIGRKS
ncbi:hypothetical protein LFYK43_08290 [Ligilactobacillus salitolerans]|uniref:Uncharacterized protein n=1 Tax=Ligilactobacillus salitolerans TaxID=1808352 RepID=A0A401IS58_9LACO|nr:hypothetical protein [Ligilactobacillus salitolerans]GBG94370.1 hypothetical protein LFYK43_08290 [Ligilactobacillus salitolerans]